MITIRDDHYYLNILLSVIIIFFWGGGLESYMPSVIIVSFLTFVSLSKNSFLEMPKSCFLYFTSPQSFLIYSLHIGTPHVQLPPKDAICVPWFLLSKFG